MLHDTSSKLTILELFSKRSYFTFNFTCEKLAINPRPEFYQKNLGFFLCCTLMINYQVDFEHFSMVNFPTLLKVWNNRKSSAYLKIKLKSFPGRSWHTIPFTAHFKFSEKIKSPSATASTHWNKIVLCVRKMQFLVWKLKYHR